MGHRNMNTIGIIMSNVDNACIVKLSQASKEINMTCKNELRFRANVFLTSLETGSLKYAKGLIFETALNMAINNHDYGMLHALLKYMRTFHQFRFAELDPMAFRCAIIRCIYNSDLVALKLFNTFARWALDEAAIEMLDTCKNQKRNGSDNKVWEFLQSIGVQHFTS